MSQQLKLILLETQATEAQGEERASSQREHHPTDDGRTRLSCNRLSLLSNAHGERRGPGDAAQVLAAG